MLDNCLLIFYGENNIPHIVIHKVVSVMTMVPFRKLLITGRIQKHPRLFSSSFELTVVNGGLLDSLYWLIYSNFH